MLCKNISTNKYNKLINNLENNGIGVNKITETSRTIGLELTQFIHSDIRLVEQIISQASRDAGINKNIKKDTKTIFTKANSDTGGRVINCMIDSYVLVNDNSVAFK